MRRYRVAWAALRSAFRAALMLLGGISFSHLLSVAGSARSFHVDGTTTGTLLPIIRKNINRESTVMSDKLSTYRRLDREFARTKW
jgi:hypothetical protein